MIAFNIRGTRIRNYYRGHEPSNQNANCWGDRDVALDFTIEQARKMIEVMGGENRDIIISHTNNPISSERLTREIHCWHGGGWHDKL